MTSTPTPTPPRTSEAATAAPRTSAVEIATALWSVLAVVVGAWILVEPSWYPLGSNDPSAGFSLLADVPTRAVGLIAVMLGVVGIGAALTMSARLPSARMGYGLVAIGALETLVFTAIVPDIRLLILMGYVCALAGPVLVFGILIAGARGNRRNLVVITVAAAAIATGLVVFGANADSFSHMTDELAGGFAEAGPAMLFVGGAFIGGALWLASTVRHLRRLREQCVGCGHPARGLAGNVATWGRWVTIGAALCPLPYVLLRMTWMTPWPVSMEAAVLEADPGLRVFGLSLGFAALAGSVLTLGLISRWGEVFPRWIPVLRGRSVPAGPAAAAALVVAGAITLAGRSVLQPVAAGDGGIAVLGDVTLLLVPFPIWGPLLGAAAIAYFLRRRTQCRRCADS
ncbi:hypothetical protein [Nocardioides sp.]|uniref:hypothetical protein n=1 Tax=Nocardioides sp. TaxID=35761 RepID=UPI0019B2AE12|nr:hypothetical protein [Nocardioides sp.]MBC7277816.1 hypothetical protein [Nocardioides sp.]